MNTLPINLENELIENAKKVMNVYNDPEIIPDEKRNNVDDLRWNEVRESIKTFNKSPSASNALNLNKAMGSFITEEERKKKESLFPGKQVRLAAFTQGDGSTPSSAMGTNAGSLKTNQAKQGYIQFVEDLKEAKGTLTEKPKWSDDPLWTKAKKSIEAAITALPGEKGSRKLNVSNDFIKLIENARTDTNAFITAEKGKHSLRDRFGQKRRVALEGVMKKHGATTKQLSEAKARAGAGAGAGAGAEAGLPQPAALRTGTGKERPASTRTTPEEVDRKSQSQRRPKR
jgi:hypothetical protein